MSIQLWTFFCFSRKYGNLKPNTPKWLIDVMFKRNAKKYLCFKQKQKSKQGARFVHV